MSEIQYAKWILGLANQIHRVHNASTNNNGTQTRILYFVLMNYSDRDIYQKDIEEELNIRSATTSILLKKLEENGMIIREKVSYDDRLKKILPTSASIEMKKNINRDIQLVENKLTSGISQEKLNIFFEVIQKMVENTS